MLLGCQNQTRMLLGEHRLRRREFSPWMVSDSDANWSEMWKACAYSLSHQRVCFSHKVWIPFGVSFCWTALTHKLIFLKMTWSSEFIYNQDQLLGNFPLYRVQLISLLIDYCFQINSQRSCSSRVSNPGAYPTSVLPLYHSPEREVRVLALRS